MDTLHQWLADWQQYKYQREIIFIVFIPLFLILRSVLVKRLEQHTTRWESYDAYPFILSLINWGTFYAIIIYGIIYFKDTFILGQTWFKLGNTPITSLTFIIPATLISLSFKFSRFLADFVLKKAYSRYELAEEARYTFNRLIHYLVVTLAFLIALPMVGFDLSVLTVFAGVLGVGVGFGISNVASNFISGLIILFERPIKQGDIITIENTRGVVKHINMRSTVIRTYDNEHMIIPNSEFIEKKVQNWSYGDPKLRLKLFINISYDSDVKLAGELLLRAVEENDQVLNDPAPRIHLIEFGEYGYNLRATYWVPDYTYRRTVTSIINHRIDELFKEHDIEIPFPQRDIRLRSVDAAMEEKLPDL